MKCSSRRSPRSISVFFVLMWAIILGGCTGGHGGGGGGVNNIIDLNVDAVIAGTSTGPNITFTDGTNASLDVNVSNIGNLPSDQLVTVTVGLPTGVTFVSSVSTTPGWTCNASGQTITCTSSASIAGRTGLSTITINVSVASNASGTPRLTLSVSTPDGSPSTSSGSKGVIFIAATPSITSLTPNSGPGGTAVTISGSNFGASQGSSTVTFNGKTATTITSWSAASVVADVPAATPNGPGPVVVTVGGVASSGVTFTVTGPQINSLNPNSGPVGTAVTISGSNFGPSQGSSTVTFNGTPATTITTWNATSIVADVPTDASAGNVVVTVDGIASTTNSNTTFTVTNSGSGCPSGGNAASLLTGDYAFSGQGFAGGNTFTVAAGRFHADGVNAISNGLIEHNGIGGYNTNGAPVAFTGCFVLNTPLSAHGVALGTMTIVNTSASFNITLAIAIQTNGNGSFITYDSTSPQLSGSLEKQCPNATSGSCPAFANSSVSGDYGFGFDGIIPGVPTSNFAVAGRLTANGSGSTSGAVIDISSYAGVIALNDAFSASYNVTDTVDGRAEITANVTYNNGGASGTAVAFHFACYLAKISSSGVSAALHCLNFDAPAQTPLPLLSGRFTVQNTPTGGWTNASAAPASNASVIWSIGIAGSGSARVDVGQLTYNTSANPATVAINQDQNKGGSYTFQQVTEDISVASNGRLQATVSGSLAGVCYMLDPGKAVCVNEANNAALGFIVPQEAEPSGGFTAANFDNSFAFGTPNPIAGGVSDIDGVLTSTGSTGTLAGPEYVNSSSSGLSSPSFASTYSIASGSDAAIGRVTITVTSPTADTLVLYIIDANTAVAMSTTDTEPAIIYFKH